MFSTESRKFSKPRATFCIDPVLLGEGLRGELQEELSHYLQQPGRQHNCQAIMNEN